MGLSTGETDGSYNRRYVTKTNFQEIERNEAPSYTGEAGEKV